MKSEKWIKAQLARIEKEMAQQESPVGTWAHLLWGRNCFERALLRKILGLKRKPFNKIDISGGW